MVSNDIPAAYGYLAPEDRGLAAVTRRTLGKSALSRPTTDVVVASHHPSDVFEASTCGQDVCCILLHSFPRGRSRSKDPGPTFSAVGLKRHPATQLRTNKEELRGIRKRTALQIVTTGEGTAWPSPLGSSGTRGV